MKTLRYNFAGDKLKEDLLYQINSGILKVGDPILPEKKLAEKYKISYLTVRKIISELEEKGLVKRYKGKGTFVVGIPGKDKIPLCIISNNPGSLSKEENPINWFVAADTLKGILEACEEFEFLPDLKFNEEKGIPSSNKNPVIILTSIWSPEDIKKLEKEKIPYVVVNPPEGCYPCHRIVCDDSYGTYLATTHLIKLGYKKIAYLGPEQNNPRFSPRYQGFLSALSEHGLKPYTFIVEDSGSNLHSYIKMLHYLEKNPVPEAIVAATDLRAIGAMEALKKKGLKIPDDVGVVGFDDIEEASTTQPPLTTVAKPRKEMGYEAVRFIKEWFENPEKVPMAKVLKPKLVIRDSCRKNPEEVIKEWKS